MPEVGIRGLAVELRIVVDGHDGENWLYSEARDDGNESLESVAEHRRTQVIEADEVLGRLWCHFRCRRLSAVRESIARGRTELPMLSSIKRRALPQWWMRWG